MKVPCTISKNTIEVYKNVTKSDNNLKLRSDNLDWNENLVKPLTELCVERIAKNWEDYPVLDEIISSVDKCLLLETLSTNLPLELAVIKIDYDIYWKRCYLTRWPKNLPEHVKEIDYTGSIVRCESVKLLSCNGESNGRSTRSSVSSIKTLSSVKSLEVNDNAKSWKECYLEMHVEHFLENLKPEEYDAEQIKNICDLCSPYVQKMHAFQLLCSKDTASRIPLNAILTGFQNLTELTLCFKQTYVGENFSWNIVKLPIQDVKLLAKGLEKCNLKILRINNSDIDDEKAIIILKSLMKHDMLKTLDFSHCDVRNRGTVAIAKFCLQSPVHHIILSNNRIGSDGAHAVAYSLSQSSCNLSSINMKMNNINDDGSSIIFAVLAASAYNKLKELDLCGCNIKSNQKHLKCMLKYNEILDSLFLANNELGEDSGKIILEALDFNFTLKHLDIRMCNITSETEIEIRKKIDYNIKNKKPIKLMSTAKQSQKNITFDKNLVNKFEHILD